MHIGLIGGIGPAATDHYYRNLIGLARSRGFELELTIAHADSPTLLANQASGDIEAQVRIFLRLTERLERAGAHIVGVTAISGHFCIEEFTRRSPLRVCNVLKAVGDAVERAGYRKLGILGTRGAMESGLYGGVPSAEVIKPLGEDVASVHEAYLTMAAAGRCGRRERDAILGASRRMISEAGAEAIILAGTDLVLAFDDGPADFPVVDCAGEHIEALAQLAAS